MQDRFSRVSDSLLLCRLWPARLLCQTGGSPGKNPGAYSPVLIAMPFWSSVFPAALAANPTEYLVLPESLQPSSCATSSPGPHRGKPKPARAASGAKPTGRPTCRGGSNPQLKPRGRVAKEEDPKRPTSCTGCRVNPQDQPADAASVERVRGR